VASNNRTSADCCPVARLRRTWLSLTVMRSTPWLRG
jgi:hypothetical protein